MLDLGRVLCIEDDHDVVTVLKYALEHHGAEVVGIANDGPSGLTKARETQPDLILCDLMLPGMDGIAIVKQLKQEDALKAIPVVFITAYATTAFRNRTPQEVGAIGVVNKPFRIQTLGDELRKMLEEATTLG